MTVCQPADQMKGILGKKIGMTQIFVEDGNVVPVTLIEAGPCYVTQKKTKERDGYNAVQLGFDELPQRKLNKPQAGHLKKSSAPSLRHLREFRVSEADETAEGDEIKADVFEVGDLVDVVGTSKGKGFAGVVKRHGFAGGIRTHGQSDRHRAPGSIGAGTTPGRVFKGMRMAGRMGGERVTASNLEVVIVDAERNLLAVKGSVPGSKNSLVLVKAARKTKKSKGGN